MSLRSGQRLGTYEIVAPLGSGGMGEVYRARDGKLGRDVAIKVLPGALNSNADALARFEREARAVAALSHPNILSIHDFGTADGVSYAVMELLEGESLRQVLATGPLPVRRAVEYAIQIARGLAAAHDKGVVHRDLKPENVFVTSDNRVKILDFGLALQSAALEPGQTLAPTVRRATEPGIVLGTVGYMAPEQVRGAAVDSRGDIFAFGAVLYEMLTGSRAFRRETDAETMAAILRDDPPEPSKPLSPAVDRIIRHCLEKKPEARFRSAQDLAFALEAVAGTPSSSDIRVPVENVQRRFPWVVAAVLAFTTVAAALGGVWFGRRSSVTAAGPSHASSPLTFRQLTFEHGLVNGARFAPDGRTIIYSAVWNGADPRLFLTRLESNGATSIGSPNSILFGMSRSGEMAVGLNVTTGSGAWKGELARSPILGGAQRPIIDDVSFADWSPAGDDLAAVHIVGSQQQIEFPVGHVIYRSEGAIGHVRVSPDGARVAFIDWPVKGDDRGVVGIVDRAGVRQTISRTWLGIEGLAWAANGREVWYTASPSGTHYAIWASASGASERQVLATPGGIYLYDIAPDGRVLAARWDRDSYLEGLLPDQPGLRNLSWLDFSVAGGLTPDGRRIALTHSGVGSSPNYDVYVRDSHNGEAVRVGEGAAQQFSPDGKTILSIVHGPPARVMILPIGTGEPRTVPIGDVRPKAAGWLANGERLLIIGDEPTKGTRAYSINLDGSHREAVTPEGITFQGGYPIPISHDGKRVALRGPDGTITLYANDGGSAIRVNGLEPDEWPIAWTDDDRSLLVIELKPTVRIVRVEPSSGRREVVREMAPSDPALGKPFGVYTIQNGRWYIANYDRTLMTLYLIDGLQ